MAGALLCNYRQLFDGTLIERRSTYLNDVDQLAAIQLSVLFIQKQVSVQDTLSNKDLFTLQKKIYYKKLGKQNYSQLCTIPASPSPLTTSSVFDIVPFDDIYTSYVTFTKHCNMIDNADVKLFVDSKVVSEGETGTISEGKDIALLSPISVKATPIRSSHASTLKSPMTTPLRSSYTSALTPHNPTTPCSSFPCSPKDPSNLQLRRIIISYLQLIVNSRNEIALARVIDLPTRGIDQKSFTDIRKLAVTKRMPMYQAISSFVRQCILGGKGYAPDENHVLFKHKIGLLEFIDLMDKLQTAVDEADSINSVIESSLKLLKTAFVRAKHPVFSAKTVSLVIQELLDVAKTKFLKKLEDNTEVHLFLLLRDYVDLMSCLAGNEVALHSSQLCGVLSTPDVSSTTYRKISTLATNFTTPEVCDETPKKTKEHEVCKERDSKKHVETGHVDKPGTPLSSKEVRVEDTDDIDLNSIKLIRCPMGNISDNGKGTDSKVKAKHDIFGMAKKSERPVLKAVDTDTHHAPVNTHHAPVKRRNATSKSKPKAAKKIKLVSGQKTMSQFFSK